MALATLRHCAVLAALCGVFAAAATAAPTFRILAYEAPEGAQRCVPATFADDGSVTGECRLADGTDIVNVGWTPDGKMTQPMPFQDPYIIARNAKDQGVALTLEPWGNYVFGAPGQEPIWFLKGTWAESVEQIAGINDQGMVAGNSAYGNNDSDCCSAWVWSQKTGLSPIPDAPFLASFSVTRLNNNGQLTGSLVGINSSRAYIYDIRKNRIRYLGPGGLPGDYAAEGIFSKGTAINDRGQVVGIITWTFGEHPSGPYFWDEHEGMTRITGTIPNGRGLYPTDLNNRGQVVGSYSDSKPLTYRAFYWDAQTPATKIRALIASDDPLLSQIELQETNAFGPVENFPAISERGEILVRGWLKPGRPYFGQPSRFFRLIPMPNAN